MKFASKEDERRQRVFNQGMTICSGEIRKLLKDLHRQFSPSQIFCAMVFGTEMVETGLRQVDRNKKHPLHEQMLEALQNQTIDEYLDDIRKVGLIMARSLMKEPGYRTMKEATERHWPVDNKDLK